MIHASVHLVVGPTAYIGLQAQGRIVCDEAQVPLRQRTRNTAKVTCPICGIPALAAAADEAATAAYRSRLRRELARRKAISPFCPCHDDPWALCPRWEQWGVTAEENAAAETEAAHVPSAVAAGVCPDCGSTLGEITTSGTRGCPGCGSWFAVSRSAPRNALPESDPGDQ